MYTAFLLKCPLCRSVARQRCRLDASPCHRPADRVRLRNLQAYHRGPTRSPAFYTNGDVPAPKQFFKSLVGVDSESLLVDPLADDVRHGRMKFVPFRLSKCFPVG